MPLSILLICHILYPLLIPKLLSVWKNRATQVLSIHMATVLLSPLFIDELAVGCPQAVLPLQLSSAFFISASHARALIRGVHKLGGI